MPQTSLTPPSRGTLRIGMRGLISLVAVFALGAVLRLPAFSRSLLSDDEAIYAATADALRRGDLLYRDVVDHKPPLIYHTYQAGFWALGPYNTHGAHALVLFAVLLTAALLGAMKWREGHAPALGEGLAAAGLFLVFSTTWHDYDALAANCELFLLAFQTAAACLVLRSLRRPGTGVRAVGIHLAIGSLIGISALFKYQSLTFLGASLGMLIWSLPGGRPGWARAATAAVFQIVGALLPPALYLAWCAHAGNAADAVSWFKFNSSYIGAGLTGMAALARGSRRLVLIGGVALVPYALGLWFAITTATGCVRVVRARRWATPSDADRPSPSAVLGLLWLCTSAIAVATGGRFFGHYFHLILAPLCLLAASRFVGLWNKARALRAILVALCALPALAFFALATFARPFAAALDESEPPFAQVSARIAASTTPEERVFVWGNAPQLYVLARRAMGARFSFCNYMTGASPGTPTETGQGDTDANQVPWTWDMLFADLDQRRPALLVDAAAAGWNGYGKFQISRYPRLQSYVDRYYRPLVTEAGVVLYRRRP